MEIINIGAEMRLMQIGSCIGRFPQSWNNWMAMRITFDGSNEEAQAGVHHATKSIIGSYLGNVDGRVYYCTGSLHILCKDVSFEIINQAGQQICHLLSDDSDEPVIFEIYDLRHHALDYARLVDQDCNGIFFHGSTSKFLDRNSAITPKKFDKHKPSDLKNLTRVLLVEDDPVTRWMVRNTLKNECEFATAPCANKAFSMYAAFNPEIVFLDINLPDNNGYNVLQWIMRNDPGAYVVMFSSQSNLDNILEALEKGASGFIAKPFLQETLMNYVHRVEAH